MQLKSITRLMSALFCLVLIASAVFSLGHAKRRDTQTPVQVLCNPSSVASGSKSACTVTLSGVVSSSTAVTITYSGPNFKKPLAVGPTSCIVYAGTDSQWVNPTFTGNSGDVYTVTATCNGGSAYGTVTIQ